MIELQLPFPPSVNQAYRNVAGRGRVKSRAYINWIKDADIALYGQNKNERIGGPFVCEIIAKEPDRRRRDVDNIIKVVLDYIVAAGLVDDDSRCRRISSEWGGKEPGIKVRIFSYNPNECEEAA